MNRYIVIAIVAVSATAHAKGPDADVSKLIDAQIAALSKDASGDGAELYAKDATFVVTTGALFEDDPAVKLGDLAPALINATWIDSSKLTNRAVTIARDGKSAWVSFNLHMRVDRSEDGIANFPERDFRVSEIAVSTATGWKIAGGTWSQERDNASINKEAIAGKVKALAKLPTDPGDQSLRDAFSAMIAAPLDATVAARKDLVVFGSGPGERTVGGAGFKAAWDVAWKGHLAIVGPHVAHLAPSGTTGWVVANVDLTKTAAKKPYKIPFRLVCVFDRDDKGAWTLVHMHIAVPFF